MTTGDGMDGEGTRKAPALVVVVGSINVDFVVTAERLPRPGETVTGGSFSRHWGGKGANQAVAAARYGAEVYLLGAVGDDDLGEASIEAMEGAGVSTDHVERAADAATGVAFVIVDESGENQILVAPGANDLVDGEALEDLLANSSGGGVLLTVFEVPDAAITRALEVARTWGWTVMVNPAPARDLVGEFRDSGAILTPNRGELSAIAPKAADAGGEADASQERLEETARRLSREVTRGPVVVTLGADGALVVTEEDSWRVAAPQVEARDTTGAGDAFNGVLAAALAEGRPLREAVEVAVAAAAFSTESEGAREGMLPRDDLERRMKGS
ncbi:MAG: ribokinase [Actinomycetota bacterium]|nr:ribokinase [Actinomycetota bacterium]